MPLGLRENDWTTRNLGCFMGKTKISSLPPEFRCVAEKPSLTPIGKAAPCARKEDLIAGCCTDWKVSLLAHLQIKGRQLIWSALWFGGGRETSSGVVACLGGWCHDLPPLSHLFCWLAHSIGSNGLIAPQASSHVSLNHSVLMANHGQSSRPSRIHPLGVPSRIPAMTSQPC